MKILYIISDIGKFDGISMQYANYVKLFKEYFGFKLYTVTGKINEDGSFLEHEIILVPEISIENNDRQYLYQHSCTKKFEINKWNSIFEKSKSSIKQKIKKIILDINPDLIIMHNIFSLAHFHISTAMALRELVDEFSKINFIAIAPDSDYERPERIRKWHQNVLELLGYKDKLPGPINKKNLYYVILNSVQKNTFIRDYQINENHIFQIPDFEDFEETKVTLNPKFLEFLSKNFVTNDYKISKSDIFIVFAVRPIARKNIIECIQLGESLRKKLKRNIIYLITHPDKEEYGYHLKEIIAKFPDTPLIYLGEKLSLRKTVSEISLEEVYHNLSELNTIGFVGSSLGGWENATVELSKHKIPVFVNPELPSYPDMKKLGLKYFELPIKEIKNNLPIEKFIDNTINLINSNLREICNHNYKICKHNLSIEAAKRKWDVLLKNVR